MKGTVRLCLTVGKDVPAKLTELTRADARAGELLTQLVRLLYTVQTTSTEENSLEDFLSTLPRLIALHKENEQIIAILRRRLNRMTKNQEELLATVRLLQEALADFLIPSTDRRSH